MGTRLNQRGFSLFGMSLALSLAMSFLIYTTPMITRAYDQVLSRATSERVRLVYDGAYNHYIDEGAWPVDVSSLVSEGYLSPTAVETVWGSPITLAVSGSNLLLSFSVPDNKFVQMIRGQLPAPTVVGTTITEQLAPPGQQVSLLALQDLAGTRSWTGDYNADGNNLNNLNDLNASGDVTGARFVDNDDSAFSVDPDQTSRMNYADLNFARLRNNYTEGAACTTKQIGTNSIGEMLSCVSGVWVKVGGAARFFRVASGWSPMNGSVIATCPVNSDLIGGTCSRLDNEDESRGIQQGENGNGWQCWHNFEWDSRVRATAFCAEQ